MLYSTWKKMFWTLGSSLSLPLFRFLIPMKNMPSWLQSSSKRPRLAAHLLPASRGMFVWPWRRLGKQRLIGSPGCIGMGLVVKGLDWKYSDETGICFQKTFGERPCWVDDARPENVNFLFPQRRSMWGLPHSPAALNQPPGVLWHRPSQIMGMGHNIQACASVTTRTKWVLFLIRSKNFKELKKPKYRQSDRIEVSKCNDLPGFQTLACIPQSVPS